MPNQPNGYAVRISAQADRRARRKRTARVSKEQDYETLTQNAYCTSVSKRAKSDTHAENVLRECPKNGQRAQKGDLHTTQVVLAYSSQPRPLEL